MNTLLTSILITAGQRLRVVSTRQDFPMPLPPLITMYRAFFNEFNFDDRVDISAILTDIGLVDKVNIDLKCKTIALPNPSLGSAPEVDITTYAPTAGRKMCFRSESKDVIEPM